jgi:hypothetical protein
MKRKPDHDSTGYLILFSQIIGDILKKIDWLVLAENGYLNEANCQYLLIPEFVRLIQLIAVGNL